MRSRRKTSLYRRIIVSASVFALTGIIIAAVLIFSNSAKDEAGINMHTNNFTAASSPIDKIRNPNSEIRGVWIASVANINFPQAATGDVETLCAEIDDIIKTMKSADLNAVYFQARPSCDALYPSEYFPISKFLTGKQGKALPENFDIFKYLTEQAHKNDIAVYAWVNPLRITTGTKDKPQHDLSELAWSSPARLHPDWVIPYDDGKLYFDCGLPDVRKLVADGVAEIVQGYDIEGVVFDDYFYPYPVSGGNFDDGASYAGYGGGMALDDWRRENVNKLVELCYNTVKAINSECSFGIAPFGIWQNDDGTNGGSETNGLSSYSEIYCNPLAWIEGGYIDFIAPQIYWQFSSQAARYDVLVRWWNAQLEGHDNIDLLICHAAYRVGEWESSDEIRNQIEYARSERSYAGSIMYGYAAIKANEMNIISQLTSVYSEDIVYGGIGSVTNGAPLSVSSPSNGEYVNYPTTYIIGVSDPAYPLYLDGKGISRTKNGYFSIYTELKKGENVFTFSHKGEQYNYIIKSGAKPVGTKKYAQLDSFKIASVSPTCGYIVDGGTTLKLSVSAPSGSSVSAQLGDISVTLLPTINPPSEGDFMKEVYTGTLILPDTAPEGEMIKLGTIKFSAVRGDMSDSANGSSVRIKGEGFGGFAAEVIRNDCEMKIEPNSWYYDDYTPASKGMHDNVVSLADGYYKTRIGAYIAEQNLIEIAGWIPNAVASDAYSIVEGGRTKIYIKCSQNVPLNGYIDNGKFILTMYNLTTTVLPEIKLSSNPLFTEVVSAKGAKKGSARYYLTLVNTDNFYGFEFYYENGYIVASFKNPEIISQSDKPLRGKVIVLDAGHGGDDTGAAGPDKTYNEANMNLDIVLSAADILRGMGADVRLTREDDSTVSINYRMQYLMDINPDLCVSIHQNSMLYNSDITKIRGTVGLFYSDSGKLLTKKVSSSISVSLNRLERTPTNQRLAMVRNPKFPSTLVEVGFITCVEEYDLMRRDGSIERAAEGVAQGILDFYKAQGKYVK